ncbi:MAG: hypothetical protein J6X22_03640 [Muribaculaceae bacterium]|nr:hypothetical protein [Muribaculaceae bacterium]
MKPKKLNSTLIETIGIMVGMYVCNDTIPHDKAAMRYIGIDICKTSGIKWTEEELNAIIEQAEKYISNPDLQ